MNVITVLFESSEDRRNQRYAGSIGWGLYTPEWADKLYRGIARHYKAPFDFYCITTYPPDAFAEPVHTIPFLINDHIGEWICLTEIFRSDLNLGRAMFCGLDTVILGDITDFSTYTGSFAMTKNQIGVGKYSSNAVVLYEGQHYIWDNYINDPGSIADKYQCPWVKDGQKIASEMIYWSSYEHDLIDVAVPSVTMADYSIATAYDRRLHPGRFKGVDLVYFRGRLKPHNAKHPTIYENWV